MITLFHSPFTRSHLIRFALEELGLPHEVRAVNLANGEHKAPDYLRVNPLGQLPALVDRDTTLREAAAIALHLADQAPERGLSPRLGSPERAIYYQWVVFSTATELVALSKIALHTRVLPSALRIPAVAEMGHREWEQVAQALVLGIKGRHFLLGDAFSIADVMVGGALWLADFLGVLGQHPELVSYYGRVSERPAFQRAFGDVVPA
jgi:glutathione S-transferase